VLNVRTLPLSNHAAFRPFRSRRSAPLSAFESGGNPNAMQIDFPRALLKQWHLPEGTLRLKRQPTTEREALEWLSNTSSASNILR